jgi:hypothetical protein
MSMRQRLIPLPRQGDAPPISGPLPILTAPAREPEPWATETGRLEGREWFRRNPNAPRAEYLKWVRGEFIPSFLRGMGWDGKREDNTYADARTAHVRVLAPDLDEVLDDLTAGLAKAYELHERRRRAHDLD